jgi:hypothetical protein
MRYLLIVTAVFVGASIFYVAHKESYILAKTEGHSMTPCFEEGRTLKVYPNKTPTLGDTIIVKCNAEKCKYENIHKYLIGKKEDCIYIIGCSADSFDSKKYGWLCGDEYDIKGVTTKK